MSPFEDALDFTLQWEGGYVNDPRDPGGETYRGISRRNHPEWDGWKLVDKHELRRGDVHPCLEPLAVRFYRQRYWDPIHGDELPPSLALAAFDWAVHSGVSTASRALQLWAGLSGDSLDGIVGPQTLAAVHDRMDRDAAHGIVGMRREFVSRLLASRPGLAPFRRGWLNRLDGISETIG